MTAAVAVARRLGWTEGQVWTVAVGLALALPGALFGVGPARFHDDGSEAPIAAAAPLQQPPSATTPPSTPPAILSSAPAAATAEPTARSVDDPMPPRTASEPPAAATADAPVGLAATITGSGGATALAVAADALAVAVGVDAGQPGRLVVLDTGGDPVATYELRVGDVPYADARGVAVTEGGVLVSTVSPPAVLRVDTVAGTVALVADVPDLAPCVPIVAATSCQPLAPDRPPEPRHLAVTGAGDVFLADAAQGCVFRVGQGDNVASAWLCDPLFTASPTASGGGLAGLAAASDRVVFSVASGLDGADGVYEARVEGATAAAGERRLLGRPPQGAGVGGVVLLPDGRVVATLATAGSLLVVEADGSAQRIVELDDDSGAPLDVDVVDESLVVLGRVDGSAGRVTSRPVTRV